MKTYTLATAKENFEEMIEHAQEGLKVYFTDRDGCEYELLVKRMPSKKPRVLGTLRGKIRVADDFNDPLPEFEPYM